MFLLYRSWRARTVWPDCVSVTLTAQPGSPPLVGTSWTFSRQGPLATWPFAPALPGVWPPEPPVRSTAAVAEPAAITTAAAAASSTFRRPPVPRGPVRGGVLSAGAAAASQGKGSWGEGVAA